MKLGVAVCLLLLAAAPVGAQTGPAPAASPGESLFQAQCGFCHGRDATGGASGPDLTDSELVAQDRAGNQLGPVIRAGRPEIPPAATRRSDPARSLGPTLRP